jgi:hypothetical protein
MRNLRKTFEAIVAKEIEDKEEDKTKIERGRYCSHL